MSETTPAVPTTALSSNSAVNSSAISSQSKASKLFSYLAAFEDRIIPAESNLSTGKSVSQYLGSVWRGNKEKAKQQPNSANSSTNNNNSGLPQIELRCYNAANQLSSSKYHTHTVRADNSLTNAVGVYKWLRLHHTNSNHHGKFNHINTNNAENNAATIDTICETGQNIYQLTLDDVHCFIGCVFTDSTTQITSNQAEIGPIIRDPALVSASVEQFITGQASFIVREQVTEEIMTLTIKRTTIRVVPVRGGDSKFSFRVSPAVKFGLDAAEQLKFTVEEGAERKIFRGIADTAKTRDIIGLLVRRLTQPVVEEDEEEEEREANQNSPQAAPINTQRNGETMKAQQNGDILRVEAAAQNGAVPIEADFFNTHNITGPSHAARNLCSAPESNNPDNSLATLVANPPATTDIPDLDFLSGFAHQAGVTHFSPNRVSPSSSPKSNSFLNDINLGSPLASEISRNLSEPTVDNDTTNSAHNLIDISINSPSSASPKANLTSEKFLARPASAGLPTTTQSPAVPANSPLNSPLTELLPAPLADATAQISPNDTLTVSTGGQNGPNSASTANSSPAALSSPAPVPSAPNFLARKTITGEKVANFFNSLLHRDSSTRSATNSSNNSRRGSAESNEISPAVASAGQRPSNLTVSTLKSPEIQPELVNSAQNLTSIPSNASSSAFPSGADELSAAKQQNKQLSQRLVDIASEKQLLKSEIARLMEVQRVSDAEFSVRMQQFLTEKDKQMHIAQQQGEDNEALKKALQALSEQLANLNNELSKFSSENKMLREEKSANASKLQLMGQENSTLLGEIKQLKEKTENLGQIQGQLTNVQQQNQTNSTLLAQSRKEIEIYRRELQRCKEINAKLDLFEMENHKLMKELSTEKQRNAEFAAESKGKAEFQQNLANTELKQQLETEKVRNTELSQRLSVVSAQFDSTNAELTEMRGKLSEFQRLEAEISGLSNQKEALSSELKAAQEQSTVGINYWKRKCESLQQLLKEKQLNSGDNTGNNTNYSATPRSEGFATPKPAEKQQNDAILSLKKENKELSDALAVFKRAFEQQLEKNKAEREQNLYLSAYNSPAVPQNEIIQLKELANSLTEQIANKDIALNHMKQTNVILSKRVNELESRFRRELAGGESKSSPKISSAQSNPKVSVKAQGANEVKLNTK
jgi:hypothetical protein